MKTAEVIDKIKEVCRRQHLAYSTEKTYCHWVSVYCYWLAKNKPDCDSTKKVEMFLSSEARRGVSASTQNQAFAAILFLYTHVLKVKLENIDALRAKRPERVRHAPSQAEVAALMREVRDSNGYPTRLITFLLYACGLRVNEPLSLRIKDVDLEQSRLTIRDPKHGHDRVVPLPCSLVPMIEQQITRALEVHRIDQRDRIPVKLPGLLAKKYPQAQFDQGWAWLFPMLKPCKDPRGGEIVRWHCLDQAVQRAVKDAVRRAGITGIVTPHHLRHAYATHAVNQGAFVRDVQVVMGHRSLETTMGYLHAESDRVPSPFNKIGVC